MSYFFYKSFFEQDFIHEFERSSTSLVFIKVFPLFFDSAKIWNELKNHYTKVTFFRIDLQEKIYMLKHGDQSINVYYTKLKKLWQEQENFRLLPTYTCNNIKCSSELFPKIK